MSTEGEKVIRELAEQHGSKLLLDAVDEIATLRAKADALAWIERVQPFNITHTGGRVFIMVSPNSPFVEGDTLLAAVQAAMKETK